MILGDKCPNFTFIHGIMGRRFPVGGLLRYRKWVPQQLGDVNKQESGDSQPMGARHGDTSANHMDLLSGCGQTNIGTSFPLFHAFLRSTLIDKLPTNYQSMINLQSYVEWRQHCLRVSWPDPCVWHLLQSTCSYRVESSQCNYFCMLLGAS